MHTPSPSAGGGASEPTSPMRGRILLWAITSSLAGFLFGFDTVVISGADQPGLLQAVAAAFARANVSVHHARISTEGGVITDRFEVSDRHGRKIAATAMSRVESLLS